MWSKISKLETYFDFEILKPNYRILNSLTSSSQVCHRARLGYSTGPGYRTAKVGDVHVYLCAVRYHPALIVNKSYGASPVDPRFLKMLVKNFSIASQTYISITTHYISTTAAI